MNRETKRTAFSNLAASSLIVACSMVGCTGQAVHTSAGASAGKLAAMADAQAHEAEAALRQHDAGQAIQIAEAAVAAFPDKAEYRTLLGRAYLMDGRFASARTAFEDALTLGSTDGRNIVNLSLIHVASGDSSAAQHLLSDHVNDLTAADYGLAMAMAGNPDEAIRVLSQAIHATTAGAKERQNLAYAYALAGQWTEARQVAMLDLAPLDAAKRVLQWAQSAQPGAESQRVIAMMGVAPRGDDTGLPVRLALGQPKVPAPVQMADAALAPSAPAANDFTPLPIEESTLAPAPAVPVKLAEAAPTPEPAAMHATASQWAAALAPAEPAAAPVAPVPAQVTAAQWAATIEDDSASVPEFIPAPRAPAKVAVAMPAAAPSLDSKGAFVPARASLLKRNMPAARPASIWQPVDAARGSAWVVQLGAFSTPQAAAAAWNHYVRGNEKLGLFPQVVSQANVNGTNFHRLAIAGFGDRAGADRMCGAIRAAGGACFVRLGGAEAAPVRWARAKIKAPALLAMR